MEAWLTSQAIYLMRIVIAAVCGAAIGYERQNRLKTAGVRTHVIVSIAAALMMVISKYGFFDIVGTNGVGLDPSRIAAGVVTAIGFLGAGIIFVHNQTVSGLTTAAGIWATVGIGMAIGAGMYIVGIVTGLLIIITQLILHKHFNGLKNPIMEKIVLRIEPGIDSYNEYIEKLESLKIKIINTHISRQEDGMLELKLYVHFPDALNVDVLQFFMEDTSIKSVEM